jgi:Tfp pilus assembly protein PilO
MLNSFKRKEIVLVSVLALLVYILVFYKFIWVAMVPEITAQKDKIVSLQNEKEQLDTDLKDLEASKEKILSIKSGSERLDGYINNEANIMDCIEYMDNLAKIVGSDITDISIAAPEKKEVNNSQYYELKIDFTTKQNIQNIKNMVDFIENSSKLINISRFNITTEKEDVGKIGTTPVTEEKTAAVTNKPDATATKKTTGTDAAPKTNNAEISSKPYTANVTISMYAMNIEAADKFNEYARHKFNRYQYGDLSPLELAYSDLLSAKPNNVITSGTNSASNTDTKDFEISFNSFLSPGDNFTVFGIDKLKERLTSKTNKYLTMSVEISKSSYTIKVSDGTGKASMLSGSIPDRDLNMAINTNLSNIPENKKIGLNIKFVNNSGNNVNIVLKDVSRKVILTDRNAKQIKENNNSERVFIR